MRRRSCSVGVFMWVPVILAGAAEEETDAYGDESEDDAGGHVAQSEPVGAVAELVIGFVHERGEGGEGADETDGDGEAGGFGDLDSLADDGHEPAEEEAAGDVDEEGAPGEEVCVEGFSDEPAEDGAEETGGADGEEVEEEAFHARP